MQALATSAAVATNPAMDEYGPVNETAIIKYGPAVVLPTGKGRTDKRVSVVETATAPARLFAATMKGKVGAAARASFGVDAVHAAGRAARAGNYRPVAEMLAVILGEPVRIGSRARFESIGEEYAARIDGLKDGGYRTNKEGVQVPTSARVMLTDAGALVERVAAVAAQA